MAERTLVNEDVFPYPVEMPLTERELLAYADELTTLDTEETELEQKHDGEKAAFKAGKKGIEKRQTAVLDRLRTKKEVKEVDCYNDFNYFEGICEIRRVDNDEVVKTRKMTVDEYKEKLPFEKDGEDKD